MNKSKIIRLTIISILLFIVGYSTPMFIYGYIYGKGFMATLRNIPQRGILTNIASSGNLEVYPTYKKVMTDLKNNYYQNIDETKVTYSGIHGMLLAFDDPYTYFMEPERYAAMKEENEGNFSGIGAVLQNNKLGQVVVKEIMPDAPAGRAGIRAGDIIIKVDDFSCDKQDLEDVVKKIRGEINTNVTLQILRDNNSTPIKIDVTRARINDITVTAKMLDDGIGYIRLHQFNQIADSEVDKAITNLEKEGLKAIVLDLRGNPGGLLDKAIDISSRFVKDGIAVIIKEKGNKRTNLYVNKQVQNHKTYTVVVLVNGYSASASEIVSGAIKDNEVGTILGETTFGKGLVQSIVPIFDGSAISITTAKYLTPDEIDINKKGIEPDYFVKEPEHIEIGDIATDIQLKSAIDVIKVKLNEKPISSLDELKRSSDANKEEYHKEIIAKKKAENKE